MRAHLSALGIALSLSFLLPGLANAQACGGGNSPAPTPHQGKHVAQPKPKDSREPMDPRTHQFVVVEDPGCDDPGVGFVIRFGTNSRGVSLPPQDPPMQPSTPDDGFRPTGPYFDNVDDKKPEKKVVKKALLVGVGFDETDKAVSVSSVQTIADALEGSWGFPKGNIDTLLNKAATKEKIIQRLDMLIADVKNATPASIEAYFVFVSIQGHSTNQANPAKAKDVAKGATSPGDVPSSVAFAAADWTQALDKGLLYPFEIQNRLDALSQALLTLDKGGVKTGLIVQMDVCFAESYFDGWRGKKGDGNLPSNVYVGWSSGRDKKAIFGAQPNAPGATPWAQGFAEALGTDPATGGDLHPSVQDANKAAAQRANQVAKKATKGQVEDQGAGSDAPKDAAPLAPSDYPKPKKT